MPKFELILTRDVTESVTVTITAENEGEAAVKAIEHPPELGWELDDGNLNDDPYVTDIEEVAQEAT